MSLKFKLEDFSGQVLTREDIVEIAQKKFDEWLKGQKVQKVYDHSYYLIPIEPEKPKTVEKWQWVFRHSNGLTFTQDTWMTEEEAKKNAGGGCTFIGKDPNCIKPLICEEE